MSDRTNLLLLHELGIGAIVYHVLAKDRGGQDGVNILSTHILELAVQNELVALGSHIDSGLLSQENEGKDVAIL